MTHHRDDILFRPYLITESEIYCPFRRSVKIVQPLGRSSKIAIGVQKVCQWCVGKSTDKKNDSLFSKSLISNTGLVGWARLELATNGLKVRCSNQLSYQPQARYYDFLLFYCQTPRGCIRENACCVTVVTTLPLKRAYLCDATLFIKSPYRSTD